MGFNSGFKELIQALLKKGANAQEYIRPVPPIHLSEMKE